jgi:hypothetical protein
MNTQENNKLIAEFMELELEETLEGLFVYARKEQSPIKLNDIRTEFYEVHELQYHISWDWLMPVVERIESFIFDENNSYNVTIGSTNYCIIQDSNGDRIEIIKDNGETKLETLYKAVVEFIKQY